MTLVLFLLEGKIGLNISDEGLLWYGVKAVHEYSAVPLLTFWSYDPGRYYWGAAWALLLGDGIMAVRFAAVVFNAIGLTFGLLAVKRVCRQRWLMIPAGLILLAWMFPRHKFVEASAAMIAVYFGTVLLQMPRPRQYFISGVVVGLIAFFGRNLGVYAAGGFLVLIALIFFKIERCQPIKRFGLWLAGIIVGYLPMLMMIGLIPGFFNAFIESILNLLRLGEINLALPIPWLWALRFPMPASTFSLGVLLLFAPLWAAGTLIAVIGLPLRAGSQGFMEDTARCAPTKTSPEYAPFPLVSRSALTIAGVCFGIFFLHHAFSRADISHMAQSIHPILLALIGMPLLMTHTGVRRWAAALVTALLITVTLPALTATPLGLYLQTPADYVQFDAAGDPLQIARVQRDYLAVVEAFAAQREASHDDAPMLAIPYESGIYAILNHPSPIWDTYLVFHYSEDVQNKAIRDIANVDWILLGNDPVDGRADKRLVVIYPLLWDYIQREFEAYPVEELPASHTIMVRR